MRVWLYPLQHGAEEAVGAVAEGGQGEVGAGARDRGVEGPGFGQGDDAEGGLAGEEGVHLGFVLVGEEGAGGVDEASAGADEAGGGVEDHGLLGDEFLQVQFAEAEAGVGVAAPGAGAGAGGVHQHAVEGAGAALGPFVAGGDEVALGVADAGAAEAAGGAFQAGGGDVAGDELAAVLHQHGQGQGLAPCPGAPVHDAHVGRGADEGGDELAAFVLDFDQAGLEGGAAGDGAAAVYAEAPGGERGGGGFQALGEEGGAGFVAGVAEEVDAEVEGGRVEGGVHFGLEVVAEAELEVGEDPVGDFGGHGLGHVGVIEGVAVECSGGGGFGLEEGSRAILAAGVALGDAGGGPAFEQEGGGDEHAGGGGGAGLVEPPA